MLMKKHIIIAGVPRSGKSTISQRISRELGYQHISMDSIIAGIESVFQKQVFILMHIQIFGRIPAISVLRWHCLSVQ